MPAPEDRPASVRPGEELDLATLESFLRARDPDLLPPGEELRVEQFPSGYSNLTYLLRAGDRQLVLRRPPFGAKIQSAHDMGREHRILSALDGIYPKAPRPRLFCDDEAVLGAPFYLMERVRGVILRPTLSPKQAPPPEALARAAEALVETLAELHGVDPQAVGLGDLGKPEGYVRRQVEGWSHRWSRARTNEAPEVERLLPWLAENQPPESGAALIHNDFKYDNVVFEPGDVSRVRAVLDWEMATLGDPLMDLGTSLGYWAEAGDPPGILALGLNATALPGNPGRREVVERYAAVTGRDPGGHLVFYFVYGLFKIAVIAQQIYRRFQLGHTSDPRFAALGEGVRQLGLLAGQALDRNRIDRLHP